MQKTLIIVLLIAVIVLAGVIVYQKLTPTETTPIVVNQPVVNQPAVNQPTDNQPSTNTNCIKEGEDLWADTLPQEDNCCSGLNKISTSVPTENLAVDPTGCTDSIGKKICTACGNGVCGKGENKCNCPQDCTSKLTLNVLNNAEYYSSSMLPGQRIKLVNGTYQPKPPIEGTTKLETNSIAYGDLNNDGQEDAVVVLATSGGGTGVFRDLEAVLNQNGKAFNIAMQSLGDRPTINSITIESGVITIDISPKGDPRKIIKYKLSGNKLQEVN